MEGEEEIGTLKPKENLSYPQEMKNTCSQHNGPESKLQTLSHKGLHTLVLILGKELNRSKNKKAPLPWKLLFAIISLPMKNWKQCKNSMKFNKYLLN